MTLADLHSLLRDVLRLWRIDPRVTAEPDHIAIARPDGIFRITQGPAPSITALRTALRAALGLPHGASARIGPGAAPLPPADPDQLSIETVSTEIVV